MTATSREWPDEPAPHGAIPAATLMIARRGKDALEFLMVTRAKKLRFAGGAMVFPGGRVDPQDRAIAAELLPLLSPGWGAAHVAAIRETLEETGLLIGIEQTVTRADADRARDALLATGDFAAVLRAEGWTLAADDLVPFARWCPPTGTSRVFDTRFLIADIGTGAVAISADGTESDSLMWGTAADILDLHERGEIVLVHPTIRNLQRVAPFLEFEAMREHALAVAPRLLQPTIHHADGKNWISMPAGYGYPPEKMPFRPI